MTYTYTPRGVCSRRMVVELSDSGVIENVRIDGGCSGNLQGISRLVVGMKAEEAIARMEVSSTSEQFDYVFIDPPYSSDLGKKCLQVVARALNQGGVAIYESEKPFDGDVDGLILTDRRKYGRAHLTFFVKK